MNPNDFKKLLDESLEPIKRDLEELKSGQKELKESHEELKYTVDKSVLPSVTYIETRSYFKTLFVILNLIQDPYNIDSVSSTE